MVSRKRNKGRDRKAKKAELEAEKIESNRVKVRIEWEGWARGYEIMSGMKVIQCIHGFATTLISCENNHPVSRFLDTFFMNWSTMSSIPNLRDTFTKHQEIWNDKIRRETAIDIFTVIGTNFLLSYKIYSASNYTATAIAALENYDGMGNIESSIKSRHFSTKLRDLCDDGSSVMRDLLKFYRKRISCSCLKEMHLKSRKSLQKVGPCFGCAKEKRRDSLLVCGRCRVNQYCSKECQTAHWPDHCTECGILVRAHKQQTNKQML